MGRNESNSGVFHTISFDTVSSSAFQVLKMNETEINQGYFNLSKQIETSLQNTLLMHLPGVLR